MDSLYDMGIDVSLPAKDKKWVEQQKESVLNKIDEARVTVSSAGASVALGLGLIAGVLLWKSKK